MSEMREFIKKGQIPTFDCDEGHWTEWNAPLRVLSSGAMKTICPMSWSTSPGYKAPLCPHSVNPWRIHEECEMNVKPTPTRGGKTGYIFAAKHNGCIFRVPIPYNGVETFEDLELGENSDEEIDVYSSAFHSRNYARTTPSPSGGSIPGPSGSRGLASSPPDYTPLPNSDDTLYTPSPSPQKPVKKSYPNGVLLTEKVILFSPQEMDARANPDLDLTQTLLGCEKEGVWRDEPSQHPAWDGNTLPSRIAPYTKYGPCDLFDHLNQYDTAIGKALKDLNTSTGLVHAAFLTLCGESRTCWLCNYLKNYSVVRTDSHIDNRLMSLAINPPSELPRRDALWSLVGTIWLMWNSRFGVPADVWAFARTAIIQCKSCGMVRSFEADRLHCLDGRCTVHTGLEVNNIQEGSSEVVENGSLALVLYKGKGKARD
ncbi:hypothetical protein PQX77_008709 [Marasmius sp. AFHP31]|nr:hypothetical protein PQX77_008709 [Marasmius sp. AFHP31]